MKPTPSAPHFGPMKTARKYMRDLHPPNSSPPAPNIYLLSQVVSGPLKFFFLNFLSVPLMGDKID